MIVYSEINNGKQTYYEKHIINENNNIDLTTRIHLPLYTIEKDNFTFFVLYDNNMNVIRPFYNYLNAGLIESPLTTRRNAATALKLLYSFLYLENYDITAITTNILTDFFHFARGINVDKVHTLKTTRSASTINNYLAFYRKFFEYNNIECEPLFKSHSVILSSNLDGSMSSTHTSYDNNLKVNNVNENVVPQYISPSDFSKIYQLVLDKDDKTAQLLMHLMYVYGLRLGECLGITMEDIKETHDNNKLVPVILLRNRLSDAPDQFCKGLIHVNSTNQYKSKDYQASKHKIIITYDLYEELINYIEETHAEAIEKHPNNYEKATADIVSLRDIPDSNAYVFLNKLGSPLTAQTWNRKLRSLFNECGLHVDTLYRENNLSHRFRHGFAMFHSHFSEHPVDVLVLAKLMRHKSIKSTMVYYNPTFEDELEIKTSFQEELFKLIPELKIKEEFND